MHTYMHPSLCVYVLDHKSMQYTQEATFLWSHADIGAAFSMLILPKGYFCFLPLISFNEKFRRIWQWDPWMVNNLLPHLSQLCFSYKRNWRNCSHCMFLWCATPFICIPILFMRVVRERVFDSRLLLCRINGLNSWCDYRHSCHPSWNFQEYCKYLPMRKLWSGRGNKRNKLRMKR